MSEDTKANSQIKPSLGTLLNNSVKGTCLDSTLMGIPNILKESNHLVLRIIWILCFLICCGFCFYFVILSIQQYLTYSTYLAIQTKQSVPAEFPMVSFCNIKPVNYSSTTVKTFLFSQATNYYLPQIGPTSMYEWAMGINMLLRILINRDPSNVITDSNRKSFGYEIEDMLISCYFNYKPCYASDFTYFYSTLYGNCYTFNSGVHANGSTYPVKTTSSNNALYGLTLELYLGDPYLAWPFQMNDGFYISIQNQTEKPFWQGDALKVDGGCETDFILKRNLISKLPQPYGNCSDGTGSTYYNNIVNTLGASYNHEFCFSICMQSYILQNCNCYSVYLPADGANSSNSFCNNPTSLYCATNISSNGDVTQTCENACPFECDYTEYTVTASKANYPTYTYNGELDKYLLRSKGIKQTVNYTSQAYSKINIFYHEMKYTTTVETASMQIPDLISNFGGTVGLYIGFSFLTLAEVIEIAFNISYITLTYLISKRQFSHLVHNKGNYKSSEINSKSDIQANKGKN